MDAELAVISQYLIKVVCPAIFNKTAKAEDLHHLVGYRLYFTLFNLVFAWLMLIFEPNKVKLSFWQMLKSSPGYHSFYVVPCGQIADSK